MKRQELSPNRQAVQSVVLVRGRSGGTDPSAGPRRLGRALAAVHLLPREKENIVLGGAVRPRMGSSNSASAAVGRRAEAGGSNGPRLRLGKVQLQKLAGETGLRIVVCHFPPGAGKGNKIEHRLFSCISQSWRGKPLISFEVIRPRLVYLAPAVEAALRRHVAR
jgi:hypothetical protein